VPLADALLDQRAIAGLGNVFKSEVLFEAGLDPFAPVSAVDDARLAALVAIARRQIAANVGPGSGHGRRTTGRMAREEGLWVYGRGGRPCRRCGTAIAFRKQGFGARPTYWCPTCQPSIA
jgi:endonuclease-8